MKDSYSPPKDGEFHPFFAKWDEHYVKINGECHPDFIAYPIGHKYGVKVCVRKPESTRTPTGQISKDRPWGTPGTHNKPCGWYYDRPNLYDPDQEVATQTTNPNSWSDRWHTVGLNGPSYGEYIRNDYIQLPVTENGTGIPTRRGYDKQAYDVYGYPKRIVNNQIYYPSMYPFSE